MTTGTKPSLLSMLPGGDSPRARRTDKATSHAAADTSQATMRETRVRVLQVVRQHGELVGSEINDLYRFASARFTWPKVAWDTPRKRAGELAADGYLEVVGERPAAGNHQPESIYRLSEKGARVLSLGRQGVAA